MSAQRRQPGLSPKALVGGALLVWLVVIAVILLAAALTDGSNEVLVPREVEVELTEFEITPDVIEVPPGTDLTFTIRNVGDSQHDLQVSSGAGTDRIDPGGSVTLEVGAVRGDQEYWCSIKGHRENGMEGLLIVTEADEVQG